jgi:phosphoglycolate phosphatase-like HAD superfamily hydrolase
MDGTLIISETRPKNKGKKTQHSSFMSIKSQMKEIVVKNGVPAEKVMELDRMSLIWNETILQLERQNVPEQKIQKIIQKINVPFMIEERSDHDTSVLISDTIPSLNILKGQDYEMGLVTTASRESYNKLSKNVKYGKFGKYFKHSVTRDECRYIKPNPEPIFRILELYGRKDFIYIGDSDHDAHASKAAGGLFVLIDTRSYNKNMIESLKPDIVISTLSELPSILKKLT